MTEKEKMVTKKLYDANYDETLYKERTEAKNLCYDYNQLRPSDEENQIMIGIKILPDLNIISVIAPKRGCNAEVFSCFPQQFLQNDSLVFFIRWAKLIIIIIW